jgi:hypothetical protein
MPTLINSTIYNRKIDIKIKIYYLKKKKFNQSNLFKIKGLPTVF